MAELRDLLELAYLAGLAIVAVSALELCRRIGRRLVDRALGRRG